jgi:hypothetical protein
MQKFLQLQGKGEHEPFIDGLVRTCRPLSTLTKFGNLQFNACAQLTFPNVDP